MSGLLLSSPLTAQQRNFVTTIQASAEALLAVLNDVLDFSKIEAGKLSLQVVDFDLRKTVGDITALFAESARVRGLDLSSRVAADVPLGVRGDPGRLRQVLTNLVANALKFTERGFVRVSVTKLQSSAAGIELRFDIEDSGIGIDAEGRERLFRPFSQAEDSITQRYGGTGLGLAICRELVEMMRGRIGVESQPGEGSTFWFTVVFDSQTVGETVDPAGGSARLGTVPEDWRVSAGTRVLLAEDNAVNQRLAVHMLERIGCQVDVVSNGRQAVDAVARVDYDAVFLDCRMPEMDGFDAARQIRARERQQGSPQMRLIAMTAYAMAGDRERCLDAGMDDYITKPVRAHDLYAVMKGWSGSVVSKAAVDRPDPEAVLDLGPLLESLGGDVAALQHVLRIFAEQSRTLVSEIYSAAATRRFRQLEDSAHKLTGSAAQVGANEVASLAREIETYAQADDGESCVACGTRLQEADRRMQDAAAAVLGQLAETRG